MVQKTASASPCLDYHYCKGNCYQKPGPDSVGPPLGGQKFQSDTIPRFPWQCKQERPDVFIPQGMLSRLTWRLHRRFWNTINTIQSELNHSEEFSDFFFFFFLQLNTLLQVNTQQLKLLEMTVTQIYSFRKSILKYYCGAVELMDNHFNQPLLIWWKPRPVFLGKSAERWWLHCLQHCLPAFSSLITAVDSCATWARRRLIAVTVVGAP